MNFCIIVIGYNKKLQITKIFAIRYRYLGIKSTHSPNIYHLRMGILKIFIAPYTFK